MYLQGALAAFIGKWYSRTTVWAPALLIATAMVGRCFCSLQQTEHTHADRYTLILRLNSNLESQISTQSLFTIITSNHLKILWLFQNFCLLWETKVCINFNAKIRVEHNRMWVLPWMAGNIARNNTWRQNSCNCWCFPLRSGHFQIVMDSVFSVKGEGKVFEYDWSAWCCQRFKSSGKTPDPCFMGKSTLGE